jgi:hypothetical protein
VLSWGRKMFSVTNLNRATQTVRAGETVDLIDKQLQNLNIQFKSEVASLARKIDPTSEVFETVTVRPKKTGISVQLAALG